MGKSSDEVGGVEFHNSGGVTEMQRTFLKIFFLALPAEDPACVCGVSA